MDLESKTDQWILGLTSAALSAAFGASAAYFHTVVNSGNWYYPRKPRNVSKDTLKNLLEESLEYVKQEAGKTVQEGTEMSHARSVDSKALKKLHHQLEDKIKRKTEELAGKYHVQEKDLDAALKYYENDETIKPLKEQHLKEKPMVLFPSSSLRQIYARMIRRIGKELELSAESLQKQGYEKNTPTFESAMYADLEECKERALSKVLQGSKLENSRLFFHLNVSAFSSMDKDFQSLMENEQKYKIQMLDRVGCQNIARQMYQRMKQQEQQAQQGMGGMMGMM